jgi:DNA-directed RNA polymerase specialized sigma subunit
VRSANAGISTLFDTWRAGAEIGPVPARRAMTMAAKRPGLTEAERNAVEANIRLATYLLEHTAWGASLDRDDRRHVALVGLCRAARGYDPARGYCFSNYTSQIFQHELVRAARGDSLIPVPFDLAAGGRAAAQAAARSAAASPRTGGRPPAAAAQPPAPMS